MHLVNLKTCFIDSQSFDHILICGDFNVDFDRGGDNAQLLCNFMDDYSLVAADLNFRNAIHFTYERDDCAVRSWPDHINYMLYFYGQSNRRCVKV